MPEQAFFFRRLFRYGVLLVGHGWDVLAFWIATVYSIWVGVMPLDIQKKAMLAIHIDPAQRLAIWGCVLAAFFLYAGFRAWNDVERELAERSLGANSEPDIPSLSIHIVSLNVEDRIGSKEPPHFLAFHLEILNNGAPTSLHDWQGSYTLKDGSTEVLSETDFDRHIFINSRNLISDDRTIDRGGKRLGYVRFLVPKETLPTVRHAVVQFRDHIDVMHSIESDVYGGPTK